MNKRPMSALPSARSGLGYQFLRNHCSCLFGLLSLVSAPGSSEKPASIRTTAFSGTMQSAVRRVLCTAPVPNGYLLWTLRRKKACQQLIGYLPGAGGWLYANIKERWTERDSTYQHLLFLPLDISLDIHIRYQPRLRPRHLPPTLTSTSNADADLNIDLRPQHQPRRLCFLACVSSYVQLHYADDFLPTSSWSIFAVRLAHIYWLQR